ncbi:MAG TPA: helix-turn-helix domain-containing protein [Candidatus Paceibacterota bacterium]
MRALVREKEQAVRLRKQGYSYREILEQLNVSKSSLSDWLQALPLTRNEKRTLKKRRDTNITLGRIRAGSALRTRRLDRERVFLHEAQRVFGESSADTFFLVGVSLYWAEGSKRNSGFSFTNSDTHMIVLMVRWIERFFRVPPSDLKARLYIHKPYAHERLEDYWSRYTQIPRRNFLKTIYKPTGLLVKKRPDYKGCLRLELGKKVFLLKMLFWQNMLIELYRKR